MPHPECGELAPARCLPCQGWRTPRALDSFIPPEAQPEQSHFSWHPQLKPGAMERSQDKERSQDNDPNLICRARGSTWGVDGAWCKARSQSHWPQWGWRGLLSAVRQGAHSAINNCPEPFGSHRAIYFPALFQLVEQVELFLKGTSVPPSPGPSSPVQRAEALPGESSAAPGLCVKTFGESRAQMKLLRAQQGVSR